MSMRSVTETTPPLFLSSLLFFMLTVTFSLLTTPSQSSTSATVDSFIYGGCSQLKYTQGSPYESNVNSLLTSLVNSAMFSSYNHFTIPSTSSYDTVSGLFQCRGDLRDSDCARCVAHSVSQLGVLCLNSVGGALQLDGCFIKYDNATFLGVEDKTVVVKKCGPSIGFDSGELTRRDAVLTFLAGGGEFYRVGESGRTQGVAQCVGDLSASECQDCLSSAIGRLKTECGTASSGDMFLAKCYARYSDGGDQSRSGNGSNKNDDDDNGDEIEKTLAILIGLIAGVALIIVFLSFLRKLCEKRDCK